MELNANVVEGSAKRKRTDDQERETVECPNCDMTLLEKSLPKHKKSCFSYEDMDKIDALPPRTAYVNYQRKCVMDVDKFLSDTMQGRYYYHVYIRTSAINKGLKPLDYVSNDMKINCKCNCKRSRLESPFDPAEPKTDERNHIHYLGQTSMLDNEFENKKKVDKRIFPTLGKLFMRRKPIQDVRHFINVMLYLQSKESHGGNKDRGVIKEHYDQEIPIVLTQDQVKQIKKHLQSLFPGYASLVKDHVDFLRRTPGRYVPNSTLQRLDEDQDYDLDPIDYTM